MATGIAMGKWSEAPPLASCYFDAILLTDASEGIGCHLVVSIMIGWGIIMRGLMAIAFLLASGSAAMADMNVSFDWGPTKKCFDSKSPPISLSDVPAGTKALDIRMKDMDVPDYNHGGGKVDFSGQKSLAYGAFSYTGPCPPSGKHKYRFTVKALDSGGKTLATATADKMFP